MAAWEWSYKYGTSALPGTRKARGIAAIKHELIHNGTTRTIWVSVPVIGDGASNAIRDFQARCKLTADGDCGPRTAAYLFADAIFAMEVLSSIPEHLLYKLLRLESALDPVARGWVDVRDRGLAQISAHFYPDVSDEDADEPAFAIAWAASAMASAHRSLGDWDAAIAAHNVGLETARGWLRAGKPASGKFDAAAGLDWYARATNYVKVVRAQTVVSV